MYVTIQDVLHMMDAPEMYYVNYAIMPLKDN